MVRNAHRLSASVLLSVALVGSAFAQEWVEWTPATGPAPEPRTNAGAAYDSIGDRLIVFGGRPVAGALNDIWAFDFATRSWEELTPVAGAGPDVRWTPVVVFDPIGNRVLTWSGQGAALYNDVWSFHLETRTWSLYDPIAPLPAARYGAAGIRDPRTGALVTFAGFTGAGGRFEDTWRFDTDDEGWSIAVPPGTPGRRCLHSVSYDARGHRMVLYGGQRAGALDDTWVFDLLSDSWTNLTPEDRPSGRFYAGHDYDATRDRALIFGGNRNGSRSSEVLAFDLAGGSWTTLAPTGSAPTARDGAVAVYDIHADRLVVFGGFDSGYRNDVWALEFADPAGVPFPDAVTADATAFGWPVPAGVDWAQGDLEDVASYDVSRMGSSVHATAFADALDPAPGAGWFYLFRLRGSSGTWQTANGAEPGRDVVLP